MTNGHTRLMNPAQNAATIGRDRKPRYKNKIAGSWFSAAQLEFAHLAMSDSLSIRPPSVSTKCLVRVKLF